MEYIFTQKYENSYLFCHLYVRYSIEAFQNNALYS